MLIYIIVIIISLVIGYLVCCFAETVGRADYEDEIYNLQNKISKLKMELNELKAILGVKNANSRTEKR